MKSEKLTPTRLLIGLLLCGVLVMPLLVCITGGRYLYTMLFDLDWFIDFFQHVERFFINENVYFTDQDACFPALAYCFYYIFYLPLKAENIADYSDLDTSASGVYLIVMYTAIFFVLLVMGLNVLLKSKEDVTKNILVFGLCMSYPVALAVERGNMTMYVLLLTLFAFVFRESENKVLRELALIFIALAAALKLYPAVLGFLYLGEKKYKETLRLVLYGILCFFLPFAFFGGVNGFIQFLHNISEVGERISGVTIAGMVCRVLGQSATSVLIGKIVAALYLCVTIFLVFTMKKRDWRYVALLTSQMMVFIPESGSYCLLYWMIPLVLFCNRETFDKMDFVHAILFALIFAFPAFESTGSAVLRYVFLYIQILIIVVELVGFYFNKSNERKEK